MKGGVQAERMPPLSWCPAGLDASIAAIASALTDAGHVLVTAHQRPDGDAIGCTVAALLMLEACGVRASAYNADPVPENLCCLEGSDRIGQSIPDDVDCLLVLDCASHGRIGALAAARAAGLPIYCLDHHVSYDADFATVLALDPDAAACAELVYRLGVALDAPLTPAIARALFAALQTDTGSFRYQSTRAEQMELASILLRTRFDVWELSSAIWESQSPLRLKLLPAILATLDLRADGRVAILTIPREVVDAARDEPGVLQGVINQARAIRGVEVAVLLTEEEGELRVSFRSRGRVNVAQLAETQGGGGHFNAAACRIEEDRRAAFLSAIARQVQDELGGQGGG